MKIAIIGCGHVGSAIANSYQGTDVEVAYSDPNLDFSVDINTLISWNPNAYFVCVPTPENKDYYPGKIDQSIIKDVLQQLKNVSVPVIVKSTVMPSLWRDVKNIPVEVFHIPEFLRTISANEDYINTKLIIIGKGPMASKIEEVIQILTASTINPLAEIKITDCYTSSIIKYVINGFLAAKVVLMNQFYLLANKNQVDWEDVVEILKLDPRMGTSHFDVPGPDGKFGYGGSCLPKDIHAIIYELQFRDIDLGLFSDIVAANNIIREWTP